MLGLALNDEHLPAEAREAARAELEAATGLPAVYPLHEGVERLLPAIRTHLEARR